MNQFIFEYKKRWLIQIINPILKSSLQLVKSNSILGSYTKKDICFACIFFFEFIFHFLIVIFFREKKKNPKILEENYSNHPQPKQEGKKEKAQKI